jgi:hypothetical protein
MSESLLRYDVLLYQNAFLSNTCNKSSWRSTLIWMNIKIIILASVIVTIDGVSIGNWIYWPLGMVITSNYSALPNSCTRLLTTAHTKTFQSDVFTSRCLVAASNGGRSPYSGFPNYPRPQLPSSHSNSSQRPNCSSPLTDYSPTHFSPLYVYSTAPHSVTELNSVGRVI